jgi:hypothetical protein
MLMHRSSPLAIALIVLSAGSVLFADVRPPNAGRGAGTVPLWNPHRPAAGNQPLTVRVLVLNYDPVVPAQGHRRLSEVFRWNNPARLATEYKEAMEYASGGYLRFEVVEWRNLNEIYAQEGGHRYTVEEYVRNRRQGKGWRQSGMADYPRLLHEQNVVPLVDDGRVDEVWVFSDHFFGLFEASMAGPGAFFINGGVYPQVPSRRPFAFYGFNYERGVAEMMHDASHRTEATLNRVYGPWNLGDPKNNWEKFSANHDQSAGLAGVGTCHWPANARGDYDYGNRRVVTSWADAFLTYPKLNLVRKPVSRASWSRGPDYHLDYMKWYFGHVPRAAGVNPDGRQNNWFKYIFDFQSYDGQGRPLPAAAELHARDVADPGAATHTLAVAYRSADHIDPESLGDGDLSVTGPDGKPLVVRLVGGNEPGGRSYRVAWYRVTAPGGAWEKAPPGDHVVSLQPDRVRTATGTALPGRSLGTFRVARTSGKPAPLAADADTTLLAHFEDDAAGGKGKAPEAAKNLRYEPGVVGRGVAIGKGSELRYRAAGVLDPKAGTVEFWVRPRWDGNAGKPHVFFQAGQPFNNGLLVQIDGANNIRLMIWGDDPATAAVETNVERGVATSGAAWKAGEWHHVAATWEQSGRRLALYVDGRLADSTTKGVVIPALSLPSFWVGSGAGGAHPADAVLDELRISRRARSASEVRAAVAAAHGVESLTVKVSSGTLLAGGRAVARAFGRAKSGPPQDLTRDVAWTSSDSKVAAVDRTGTLRAGRAGQATLTARLGGVTASATVKVIDPGLPKARLLRAPDVKSAGAGGVTVVVAYDDPDGIRRDSLGLGNIRVSGPNGFQQFPALVAAWPTGKGRGVTASYRVLPPAGKWGKSDRGTYTIEIKAFQVADTQGNHVPEGVLGRFHVLQPSSRR